MSELQDVQESVLDMKKFLEYHCQTHQLQKTQQQKSGESTYQSQWHAGKLKKKSKSLEPFLIIRLFCTANQTHQCIWGGLAVQVYSSTLRSPMIFCEVMYVIHYFFYIMTNNKNNYLKIYFLFFFCLFSTLQTANKGKFYTYYMYINSTAFCILELYISSKIVD